MQKSVFTFKNFLTKEQLEARLRVRTSDTDDPRGIFFRDSTAIVHSSPFRRMKHKTQMIFAPLNDHICTRMEHTLHVATISVTIARALGLNIDLTWAISLGHDLGHAPFGHTGETIIKELFGKEFNHEIHSLRVVDEISKLNLSYAVRDGIVSHCGEKYEQYIQPHSEHPKLEEYTALTHYPATYEACVVRVADKIAYLGRDYEDAITYGYVTRDHLPKHIAEDLGPDNRTIIDTLVRDCIAHSTSTAGIGFSDRIYALLLDMRDFNVTHIYKNRRMKSQEEKCKRLLMIIYEELESKVSVVMDDTEQYEHSDYALIRGFGNYAHDRLTQYDLKDERSRKLAMRDFIAGMTDTFVISCSEQLLLPHQKGELFYG